MFVQSIRLRFLWTLSMLAIVVLFPKLATPQPCDWGAGVATTQPGIPASGGLYYGPAGILCAWVDPCGYAASSSEYDQDYTDWMGVHWVKHGAAFASPRSLSCESTCYRSGNFTTDGAVAYGAWLDRLVIATPPNQTHTVTLTITANTNSNSDLGGGGGVSAVLRSSCAYGSNALWSLSHPTGTFNTVDTVDFVFSSSGVFELPLQFAAKANAAIVQYGEQSRHSTANFSVSATSTISDAGLAWRSDIDMIPIRRANCGNPVGTGPARWKKWSAGGLVDASTGNVNCNLQTVLILHGYKDGATDSEGATTPWIDQMATKVASHYPEGVNILVADARQLMNPNGFNWNMLGAYPPGGIAAGLISFAGAWSNIPTAGQALANDLACLNCNANIPLVIGHSFGGAIAAWLCAHLGGGIGTLVTLDTPYCLTPLGTAEAITDSCVGRHVNIYVPCLDTGGFGCHTNHANAVNLRVDCNLPGWPDHNSLPSAVAAWMESGGFWFQVDGATGLSPGNWHQSGAAWSFVPGPGNPFTLPQFGVAAILSAASHILVESLMPLVTHGLDFSVVGAEIRISPSGASLPGLAYAPQYTLPANAEYLAFEYQLLQPAPGEIASVSYGTRLLWSDYTATAAGTWRTVVVYVGDSVGQSNSLVFALNPASTAGASDELRIRNIRLYDNRIFPGFKGDVNLSGTLDGQDAQAFVNVLIGSETDPAKTFAADMDGSGIVDLADLPSFIAAVLGG